MDSVKPLLVAYNGSAAGVGLTLTLPCDIRIAADTARFGCVFTRRGLVPEAGSAWFLPRLVGLATALKWCMTGALVPAGEALAAGLVTADEAKARRREVATEADFYGSMDGASKFVKGDAIAALLILAVNIIAGFCLGMISHGLSAAESAEVYVTLAVGDALVAQVPALLLSIAAAVIVTRVADDRDGQDRDLSGQIGGQLASPRTWLPVAAILVASIRLRFLDVLLSLRWRGPQAWQAQGFERAVVERVARRFV